MDIIIPVVGGLSLFLFGINMMGENLEQVAGNRLNTLLEKLTTNRFRGIVLGMVVSIILQSSSVTTVMVVGFVNAGLMSLYQAVGVLMGSNIGSTVTPMLLALDIADYAPLVMGLGVAIWTIGKSNRRKNLGKAILGFGMVFVGMDMMTSGFSPLADDPRLVNLVRELNHPLFAVLVGVLFTTVLQSSAPVVGLIQAMTLEGVFGLNVAMPLIYGANIGTTTTALLSSIGAQITAKRAAFIHLLFNIIGTTVFLLGLQIPVRWAVEALSPNNMMFQVANAHTMFNIINVALLLPFSTQLVKLSKRLVPGDIEKEKVVSLFLDERILETPSIALGQSTKEVARLGKLVMDNLLLTEQILLDGYHDGIEEALSKEQQINQLEREIMDYLVKVSDRTTLEEQHEEVKNLLYIVNDIERVGDHIDNIIELSQDMKNGGFSFTKDGAANLRRMFKKCESAFSYAIEGMETKDSALAQEVLLIEEDVNKMEQAYREENLDRLSRGLCGTGSGIVFLDTISNLERVADHSVNISKNILFKK